VGGVGGIKSARPPRIESGVNAVPLHKLDDRPHGLSVVVSINWFADDCVPMKRTSAEYTPCCTTQQKWQEDRL
jgi:hypothetical protein